jgi:very-short-patch-repair endonuclease
MATKKSLSEVKNQIINFCNKNDYSFINMNEYIQEKDSTKNILLRCNIDNNEWYSSKQLIRGNHGCKKCGDKKSSNSRKFDTNIIKKQIIKKCLESNLTFKNISNYIYNNANDENIHLLCNIDGHNWSTSYSRFVHRDNGCKICSSIERGISRKKNIENNGIINDIINRCKEMNYIFINQNEWIYEGTKIRNIKLKCNIDNYEWSTSTHDFTKLKTGCPCCANLTYTTETIKPLIIERCKELNYTFINENSWRYITTKTNNIHIKDISGKKWKTNRSAFIVNNIKYTGKLDPIYTKDEIIQLCKNKNLIFLNENNYSYKNVDYNDINLKCKKDNFSWFTSLTDLRKTKHNCPRCAGVAPYTTEEIKPLIIKLCKEMNYIFINEQKYKYTKTNINEIKLKCNTCGKEWSTSRNGLIVSHNGCSKCNIGEYNTEEIKPLIIKRCKEMNYTFINENEWVYKNSKIRNIQLECNTDNHEFFVSKHSFLDRKQNCPYCSGLSHSTKDIKPLIIEYCIKMNYTFTNCKDWIYTNSRDENIQLKCNIDNYEWTTSKQRLLNNRKNGINGGCPRCVKKDRKSTEEIINLIIGRCEKFNYTFINLNDYEWIPGGSNIKNIKLKCNKHNYVWKTTKTHFIDSETGCPRCKNSKGEHKIADFLNVNNIIFKTQKRFKDCKNINMLPFDFYLPDYNICIEYDGIQHYKVVKRFGDEAGFKKTQLNDKIKTKYCEDNNIQLIRISYLEKDIENILIEKLKLK